MVRQGSTLSVLLGLGFSGFAGLRSPAQVPDQVGPYLAHLLAGGPALVKPLPKNIASAQAWSEDLWVRTEAPGTDAMIAGVGDPASDHFRYLELRQGHAAVAFGSGTALVADTALTANAWHLLAVTDDGHTTTMYVDGVLAGAQPSIGGEISPELCMAPDAPGAVRFSGEIGGFSASVGAKPAAKIAREFATPPDFDAQLREENAKPWAEQTKQQLGYRAPQDPADMPHGAPPEAPHAQPLPPPSPTLKANAPGSWEIAANWRLYSNADRRVRPDDGAQISLPSYPDAQWLPATVPGTVLTTMIDRGIYPDPDFGLNNLAIPESLNKHDYWYRVEFAVPARGPGRRVMLHFGGINYAADVWFNGHPLGEMRGAFSRGAFDVTGFLRLGMNALAVRVAPPPHPGIPAEQSIKDGPGYDGGLMLIDGPTFVDTEGWDWMPAMRDRDTGLWQGVSLTETGVIMLGDPQVITRLPLPDTSSADVQINVPIHNYGTSARHVVVTAAFEGVHVHLASTVPVGDSVLHFTPAAFPELHIAHPRLWWPNGYGAPDLYHLRLSVALGDDAVSDQRATTFGVREVTYELTLFDHTGHLQRVEVSPTQTLGKGYDPVDVHHENMRQTANGWASTLDPSAENSPAALPVRGEDNLTDLVIKVNGVRIAVRGGNWGMDDSRKRISRQHLEPYFRLHREAHLNMIRNWVGQNTEEVFYQLADEYGLMVWNDFWGSTENYNAEPGDPQLFVDNARDAVRRYRNHPSIVIWCGRNEGAPPPVLNDMLIHMLHDEDGTRFYSPSSNQVDLRPSGPYHWVNPTLYFSELNRGFAVELGIASFPTREAFENTVAPADRWPISDAWAYHDWHQSEGGDTHELMKQLALQLGPFNSLPEFERRIQLFNYVDHQAIFEGMYAHLWQPNSGRMIWMTQPAWPSTMWQMYSSDYDTQASFYAIRKANAPLHVQMDLADHTIQVVNTTGEEHRQLQVMARVVAPNNETLATKQVTVTAVANNTTPLFILPVAELFEHHPLLFVRLELRDQAGALVADNFYWVGRDPGSYRGLEQLAPAVLSSDVTATADIRATEGDEKAWCMHLKNAGSDAAISVKLTLRHADGTRVLPAYYSDNYLSLLPGEERAVTVQAPVTAVGAEDIHFSVEGWNLADRTIPLETTSHPIESASSFAISPDAPSLHRSDEGRTSHAVAVPDASAQTEAGGNDLRRTMP